MRLEKGDLVRVDTSYVDSLIDSLSCRRARKLYGDVGIVLDISYKGWPRIVSVYWSILQMEERIQKGFLEPINEKA